MSVRHLGRAIDLLSTPRDLCGGIASAYTRLMRTLSRRVLTVALLINAGCGQSPIREDAGATLKDATAGPGDASVDATASDASPHADAGEASAPDATAVDGSPVIDPPTDASADAKADSKADAPIFLFDTGAGDVALSADTACVQTSIAASEAPLDAYIILDMSGSMTEPGFAANSAAGDCNVGQNVNSKWCHSINALSDFFSSPDMVGTRAALNFFSTSVSGTECDGDTYSSAIVPFGSGYLTLPNAQFDTAMNAKVPYNGTPTSSALKGMIKFTAINNTPGRVRTQILITDGEPSSCDLSAVNNAKLIDDHFKATGVRTYLIGMTGASFTWLETAAVGGNGALHTSAIAKLTGTCGNGAASCYHWNIGNGEGDVLVQALKEIRRQAVSCTIAIPTTDAGIIDPTKIVLEYLPKGVAPGQVVTHVNDAAGCTADGSTGGYYFDNNSSPKVMQLCPSTCTSAQADDKAKFNVLLGCQGS